MNVLAIPEDFRKDQYVLKPIIEAMLKSLGKPRAHVRVCRDPLLGSVEQALRWENIEDIIERYPMVDLFLLCVDRDGLSGRAESLRGLERKAAMVLPQGKGFFGENAWQELEVWVLAGHDLPKDWQWQQVRSEPHPKEKYFEPFARMRQVHLQPAQGRATLAAAAAANYRRIRQICPEDVNALESRVDAWLKARAPS